MLKKINLSQGGEGAGRLFHMKELSLCHSTQIIPPNSFLCQCPVYKTEITLSIVEEVLRIWV